jgi:predicted RNA-binding protein with PIN domain
MNSQSLLRNHEFRLRKLESDNLQESHVVTEGDMKLKLIQLENKIDEKDTIIKRLQKDVRETKELFNHFQIDYLKYKNALEEREKIRFVVYELDETKRGET